MKKTIVLTALIMTFSLSFAQVVVKDKVRRMVPELMSSRQARSVEKIIKKAEADGRTRNAVPCLRAFEDKKPSKAKVMTEMKTVKSKSGVSQERQNSVRSFTGRK